MPNRLFGSSLSGYCAGEHALAWYSEGIASTPSSMKLTSPSFLCGERIPERFSAKGQNVSPPLAWDNVPDEARELVLIMEDVDSTTHRPFVHLLVTGIPPEMRQLQEGAFRKSAPPPLALGRNGFGKAAYVGPRALPEHPEHRYAFQLFALDSCLSLTGPARRGGLLMAIKSRVISRARLDGVFEYFNGGCSA